MSLSNYLVSSGWVLLVIFTYVIAHVLASYYVQHTWKYLHESVTSSESLNELDWTVYYLNGVPRQITLKKKLYRGRLDNVLFFYLFFPFIPCYNPVTHAEHNLFNIVDPRKRWRIELEAAISGNLSKMAHLYAWPSNFLRQSHFNNGAFLFFTTGNSCSKSKLLLFTSFPVNKKAIVFNLALAESYDVGDFHRSHEQDTRHLARQTNAKMDTLIRVVSELKLAPRLINQVALPPGNRKLQKTKTDVKLRKKKS